MIVHAHDNGCVIYGAICVMRVYKRGHVFFYKLCGVVFAQRVPEFAKCDIFRHTV